MKSEFVLKTFKDAHFEKKLMALSVLEAAFDDCRNEVPDSFDFFNDETVFPVGKSIKVTFELIEDE